VTVGDQPLDLGAIEAALSNASPGVVRPGESLDASSGWLPGKAG
jgi:hypothetical protein